MHLVEKTLMGAALTAGLSLLGISAYNGEQLRNSDYLQRKTPYVEQVRASTNRINTLLNASEGSSLLEHNAGLLAEAYKERQSAQQALERVETSEGAQQFNTAWARNVQIPVFEGILCIALGFYPIIRRI